ncbi:class I SAM-dependent methyltransferase [Paracoccus caeni]|uniref:Class I SAM-dependent methyltransferase n=1 Tax=Paracoccus caeni TaxID=657651 RepID=A0A934SK76_9RHOB|nr:class I SAM-dependent methyltransferase [Paracoccus caeni]MBK4215923.1 class I SAM-dependent methyltransferase [Paracoccus caeni]
MDDDNGWSTSARAWIADMGEVGDFARQHVIDRPVEALIQAGGFRHALDLGCGEGRLCRKMRDMGIKVVGVEPTAELREAAEARDPAGRYVDARAESLPFADASFDLVVACLTLIDIDGIEAAIPEAARVLQPGGALIIVNLNSFATAGGWQHQPDGSRLFVINDYMQARSEWVGWRGIHIRNWHRPMSLYMQLLLGQGLRLTHYDEPLPESGDPDVAGRYHRVPYFHIMEWRKP